MKKLPELASFVLCSLFLVLCSASLGSVHAQEAVEIPGPDLKETSFIKVEDLNIGDVIFIRDKDKGGLVPSKITKLEYVQEPVEVYNLSVDGEQTFFANDFAVHNKVADRDPVCYIALSPQVSTAASKGYTETWRIGNTGSWGGNFKNLFQYSGIGRDGGGFTHGGMTICRFGELINGCQYPPNGVLPAGDPCRGCEKGYGTSCSTPASCNPQCEMTCGLYGYGHDASDRLRFRASFHFCADEYGCGSALKVTAPAGYVIKSMTYSINNQICNISGCQGFVALSRGMRWHLDDGMRANAPIATLPYGSGSYTVQMNMATKYFFIYANVGTNENPGMDLRDNSAEISNIQLEMIKTTEIHETQVEVVNNSLIWYDPSHQVGVWHFRAVDDGTISFSNDGGQTWSSSRNIPDGGNYSYPWTLDPNSPCVTAKVTRPSGDPSYCGGCITYTPPVGPTPTPYIIIEAKDTSNNPVEVRGMGFSYSNGAGGQYWLTIGEYLSSYTTYARSYNNGGGGIALKENQIYLGVTPVPGGGSSNVINNNRCTETYCTWYNNIDWYNYWWPTYPSTGFNRLTFIVGAPTPTLTLTPTPTSTPTPSPLSCPSGVTTLDDVLRGDGNYNKQVRWQDVSNEEGYRIYRCLGAGCNPTTLVTTVGQNTTSYTDTNGGNGFAPGTVLVYEVRPYASGSSLDCPDYRNDIPAAATSTPTPRPTSTLTPTPTPTPCPPCDGVLSFNDILRGDGSGNYNKNIRWTDVANETSYNIRRCSGASCTPVSIYSVGANVTSTTDDNGGVGFTPGTILWYEVRPIKAGCTAPNCTDYRNDIPVAPTPTPTPAATCTSATLSPASFSIDLGKTQDLIVVACSGTGNPLGNVNHVNFSSGDPTIASVFPPSDPDSTYRTTIKGEKAGGPITITADVYLNPDDGVKDCSGTAQVTVNPLNPWFQTQGGDVHTQEDIIDPLLSGKNFSQDLNGYPGLVSYGEDSTAEFGLGNISSKGWLAKDDFSRYGYTYFERTLGDKVKAYPGNKPTINDFYVTSGDLEISSDWQVNSGEYYVILVNGKLTLHNKIDITPGGFLAFIVKGDIIIDREFGFNPVSEASKTLEGVFLAGGTFWTVPNGLEAISSKQLVLEGVFVADRFELRRDLGGNNATYPAELFIARPDLLINMPDELKTSYFFEQEIAP